MSRLFGLRPAGLSAAFGVAVAVACGPSTIDLLPPSAGSPAGGGLGGGGLGGGGLGGAGDGGLAGGERGGKGGGGGVGLVAPVGGVAGSLPSGGHAGCTGFGCGGSLDEGGSAGAPDNPCADNAPWCMSCVDDDDCHPPSSICNLRLSLCLTSCATSADCVREGHVCDPTTNTCVACFDDQQCLDDGNPVTRACETRVGLCVECNQRVACPPGLRCFNLQCVECTSDKDCEPGRHCDEIRGHCEG